MGTGFLRVRSGVLVVVRGVVSQTQMYSHGLVSALPAGTGNFCRVPPGPCWLPPCAAEAGEVSPRKQGPDLAHRSPRWFLEILHEAFSGSGHHPHGTRAAIAVTKAALAPCTKAGAYSRGGKHPPFPCSPNNSCPAHLEQWKSLPDFAGLQNQLCLSASSVPWLCEAISLHHLCNPKPHTE